MSQHMLKLDMNHYKRLITKKQERVTHKKPPSLKEISEILTYNVAIEHQISYQLKDSYISLVGNYLDEKEFHALVEKTYVKLKKV